jgi:methylenetetrahydrofolate dehydrogenase (NADP+)/methenyltetrahydrofolate cyclohydrolase
MAENPNQIHSEIETRPLNGVELARARRKALAERLQILPNDVRRPGLDVVLVGTHPPSEVYVRNKVKATEEAGLLGRLHRLSGDSPDQVVADLIEQLNRDPRVDGILLQLPLPKGLNEARLTNLIRPDKDPDGLTTANLGLLLAGRPRVSPCTPLGVMRLLEAAGVSLAGRRAVVVGRSNIVGKPMAQLLLAADATVTIAHSRTQDLESLTREADVVVVAAGRPRLLGRSAFQRGAVVVDVGIHRWSENEADQPRLVGDVRSEELVGWASALTPVPGGVGPMTIQMLLENTVELWQQRRSDRANELK